MCVCVCKGISKKYLVNASFADGFLCDLCFITSKNQFVRLRVGDGVERGWIQLESLTWKRLQVQPFCFWSL